MPRQLKVPTTLGALSVHQFRREFNCRFFAAIPFPHASLKRGGCTAFWMVGEKLRSLEIREYMAPWRDPSKPWVFRAAFNYADCTSPKALREMGAEVRKGLYGGTLYQGRDGDWAMELNALPEELLKMAQWLGDYAAAMEGCQVNAGDPPVNMGRKLTPANHDAYVWSKASAEVWQKWADARP